MVEIGGVSVDVRMYICFPWENSLKQTEGRSVCAEFDGIEICHVNLENLIFDSDLSKFWFDGVFHRRENFLIESLPKNNMNQR